MYISVKIYKFYVQLKCILDLATDGDFRDVNEPEYKFENICNFVEDNLESWN